MKKRNFLYNIARDGKKIKELKDKEKREIEEIKAETKRKIEEIRLHKYDEDQKSKQDDSLQGKSIVELSKRFFAFKRTEKDKLSYFTYDEEVVAKSNKKPFAAGLNFYKLFWVFFIGCFLGVIIEIGYCFVMEHHYESRQGVIYGPFNPVYGFGAVVVTLVLYFLRNARDLWVFIGGAIVGGAFEFLCSWYQETFLGTISWSYEGQIGSILGGRTSLIYMLFWGILSIMWVKFIYPLMSKLIEKIPNKFGIIVTWILVAFMAFDMAVSGFAVYRMTMRHSGAAATNVVEEFFDNNYPDSYLYEIYPNMKITNPKEIKKG